MFPCMSTCVNLIWSTLPNFSLANSSSFVFHLINDDWNLIPTWTNWFFHLKSTTCFFCFSLCFLFTASLKLSEVNLTILFCLPFSSTCLIGCVLSIFLITVLQAIPVLSSMVVATFYNSSSSPGSAKQLITRHCCHEYCLWLSIFASSRVLTVWAIWIWPSSSEISPSSSSTFLLIRYKMYSTVTIFSLSLVETRKEDVGVIVGFLAWDCFILGICWMLDVFFLCLVDGMLFK